MFAGLQVVIHNQRLQTAIVQDNRQTLAADVTSAYSTESIDTQIARAREEMERAAKSLDFLAAAKFRDRMYELQKLKNEK